MSLNVLLRACDALKSLWERYCIHEQIRVAQMADYFVYRYDLIYPRTIKTWKWYVWGGAHRLLSVF